MGTNSDTENPFLDALLDLLDEDSQNNDEDESIPHQSSQGFETQENARIIDDIENLEHQTAPNLVPVSILRHLSSASAQRKAIKQDNCKFCNFFGNRWNMEEHLTNSEQCQVLYSRLMHLKTIDAILVSIFACLYCEQNFAQFSQHMKTSANCLQQYKLRFNVSNMSEVIDKILSLKKQGYKSRRSLNRSLETKKAHKKARMSIDPIECYINRHLQETAFGNVKKCCNCECNIMNAEEIQRNSALIENLGYDFSKFKQHRRIEKFFLCKSCSKTKNDVPFVSPQCEFLMLKEEEDSSITFYPILKENYDNTELDNQILNLNALSKPIKILFPCSMDSLNSYSEDIKLKSLTQYEIQNLLYGKLVPTSELLSLLYQNHLAKYLRAKSSEDFFYGEISDMNSKMLSKVQQCSGEHRIRGSDAWTQLVNEDWKWMMKQTGQNCLFVTLELPVDIKIIATDMIQKGHVISVSYTGGPSQELERHYFIHTGILLTKFANKRWH